MKAALPITNRAADCRILNLSKLVHANEARGPYIVTQDGCAPEDPTLRECSFVLTKRGAWLHFYLYLALPELVRAHTTYFQTAADVLLALESLPSKATVESAASIQELLQESQYRPHTSDAYGSALFRELKDRHPSGQAMGEDTKS